MALNWSDIQRQQNQRAIQSAKSVIEINRGYEQRESVINGWSGGAGRLLLKYSSRKGYATFGSNNAQTTTIVGP